MSSSQAVDSAKHEIRELLKAAKYPQARIFATQSLKKYGQDAELLYLRGTACAHRETAIEQAEKDLRAAIALQPKCIEYYLGLSNLLFSQSRYEAAFREFVRAQKFAPTHPKILAHKQVLGKQGGKIDRQIESIEAAYQNKRIDRGLADQVVALLYIKALFNWHTSFYGNQLVFYASSQQQLTEAETYLKKIDSMRVMSEASRKKQQHLKTLLRVSRQRRFDGLALEWGFAGLLLFAAYIAVGFVSGLYAVAAVMSLLAFRRANYLFNRPMRKYPRTWLGRWKQFLALVYGSGLHSGSRFLSWLKDEKKREFSAYLLRSLLRLALLPVSVFAGFWRNYSAWFALAYAVAALGVASSLAIYF